MGPERYSRRKLRNFIVVLALIAAIRIYRGGKKTDQEEEPNKHEKDGEA